MKHKRLIVLVVIVLALATTILSGCNGETECDTTCKIQKYGLGYGVNAFTANSPIDNQKTTLIFDLQKMPEDIVREYNLGKTEIKTTVKNDVVEKIKELNQGYMFSTSIGVDIGGLFSLGYETKFSLNNSIKTSHKTNQYYYSMLHDTEGCNYYLEDYPNIEKYQSYLSSGFIEDLSVYSRNGKYEEFFRKYGTHIKTSILYGGKIEVYYNMFSEESQASNEISELFTQAINATIHGGDASISAGAEFKLQLSTLYGIKESNTSTFFNARLIGGDVVSCSSFDELAINYPIWANSLNDKNNWRVTDIAEGGLVPIWEYIPNEFSTFKNKLIEYFKREATDNVNMILSKVNYEDGSVERPYTISNVKGLESLLNKSGEETKGKHYKLISDLDLGDWAEFGSDRWGKSDGSPRNAFMGIFDGNNHTITYKMILTSNSNSKDKETTTFGYGLFPCIVDATVKNLNIQAEIDIRDGYANCSLAGIVAGYAMRSEVNNCTVTGLVNQLNINCYYVYSGGVVGCAYATEFWDCTNNAEVYAFFLSHSGGKRGYAAGICGASDGTVRCTSCKNNSDKIRGSNKQNDQCCNV